MAKGISLVMHVLKMNGYIKRLDQLGFGMDHELSIDLILTSYPIVLHSLCLTIG